MKLERENEKEKRAPLGGANIKKNYPGLGPIDKIHVKIPRNFEQFNLTRKIWKKYLTIFRTLSQPKFR